MSAKRRRWWLPRWRRREAIFRSCFPAFLANRWPLRADVAPTVPRGLLVEGLPDDWREAAEELDVVAIHASHAILTPERVAAVHGAGYRVVAWTVNGEARARELVGMGVNAVITDVPACIKAALTAGHG